MKNERNYVAKTVGIILILLCCSVVCFACQQNGEENKSENKYYTVKYIAMEGGYIIGENVQTVQFGGMCSEVEAFAINEDYVFVGWSDGVQTASRQDSNIGASLTIQACFERKICHVEYRASEGGVIRGATEQTVNRNHNTSKVIAESLPGYRFVDWSDGYTAMERSDAVFFDCSYTANFQKLYSAGDGTTENPFYIESYQEFRNMCYYPASNFRLNCDLDLASMKCVPLFRADVPFSGTFDGGGFAIRNMQIDEYTDIVSLFGIVTGNIKNLAVENFSIIVPNYDTSIVPLYVGALASVSYGSIENISVQGTIFGEGLGNGGIVVGGLVGRAYGSIKNCYANVEIVMQEVSTSNLSFHVGGLIGIGHADISFCEVLGKITMHEALASVRVGGLASCLMYDGAISERCTVQNCTTDVEIFGNTAFNCGGLIAELTTDGGCIIVKNCSVQGNICIEEGGCVGGFIYRVLSRGTEVILEYNETCIQSMSARVIGGFLYWVSAEDGSVNLLENEAKCTMHAAMAAGFAVILGENVNIYRCWAESEIYAFLGVGFIQQVQNGVVSECFSAGTLNAEFVGIGFIMRFGGGMMFCCYSVCDINITNTNAESTQRTIAVGFVSSARNAEIDTCFYAGKILGTIYTPVNPPIYAPPIGSVFVAMLNDTNMKNSFVLYHADSFAIGIIGNEIEVDGYDFTIYYSVQDMENIATVLNSYCGEQIWTNGENGIPTFLYLQ